MAVILDKSMWGVAKAAGAASTSGVPAVSDLKDVETAVNIVSRILEIPVVKKTVEAQAMKRGIIPPPERPPVEREPSVPAPLPPPAPRVSAEGIKEAMDVYLMSKGGTITKDDLARDWPKLKSVLKDFGVE